MNTFYNDKINNDMNDKTNNYLNNKIINNKKINNKKINNKIEGFYLNNNIELECKILTLRDKLNESINDGRDYDYIYKLSLELDSLIEQYYKESVINEN